MYEKLTSRNKGFERGEEGEGGRAAHLAPCPCEDCGGKANIYTPECCGTCRLGAHTGVDMSEITDRMVYIDVLASHGHGALRE